MEKMIQIVNRNLKNIQEIYKETCTQGYSCSDIEDILQQQIALTDLACGGKKPNASKNTLPIQIVSNSLPFDKVDLLLKMQIEEVRKHVDTQARDEGAVRADFDKWIRESPILTMHRQ
jgi:hypothetical protein